MVKKETEELARGSVMISAKAIEALYGQDIWEILRQHAQSYYAGKDTPDSIVDLKCTVTFFSTGKGDKIMIATTASGLTTIALDDEVRQKS
jgi:hypothetical protein